MNLPKSLSLISYSSTTLMGFVYRVFHVESGRSYIGQTQQNPPSLRYKDHFKRYSSRAPKLQAAMKELGRTKFRAKVIETHRDPSHSELDIFLRTREAILTEEYDAIENGYNCRIQFPGNTTSDKILWKIIMERRRKYPCGYCPYRACSEAGLRVHNHKKHNGPRPFSCPWEGCAHKTANLSNLNVHMIRHIGEKRFPCIWEGCVYKAAVKMDLRRHIRTHTGEKPFPCTWEGCDYKASLPGSLRKHMLTHTKEKPHACTWEGCDYKASVPSSIHRHMRGHTREKPYACMREGCAYKSSDASNLKRHMKKKSHRQSKKNEQPPKKKQKVV